MEEEFSYVYPYRSVENMKLKFTVSELKKQQMSREENGEPLYKEEEVLPLLPKKLQERGERKEQQEVRHITNCWSCWISEYITRKKVWKMP